MKGANTPHPGFGYCSSHGGNTEAGLKGGARQAGRYFMQRFKMEDTQRWRFGGDRTSPDVVAMTPEQALVEEVRRSAAMVRFLEDRIGQWGMGFQDDTIDKFIKSRREDRDPIAKKEIDTFLSHLDPENPDSSSHLPDLVLVNEDSGLSSFTNAREWLYLYREERAHLARVAKMALDAGVAQRLVSLAEDQGRILSTALRVVLQALSLTPQQQDLIPIIVPQVLRAVANDQPIPDISSLLPQEHSPAVSG